MSTTDFWSCSPRDLKSQVDMATSSRGSGTYRISRRKFKQRLDSSMELRYGVKQFTAVKYAKVGKIILSLGILTRIWQTTEK